MNVGQVILACCFGYFAVGVAVAEVYAKVWRRDDMRATVAEMASRLETTPHSVVNVFSLIGGMYWPISVPMTAWFAVRDRARRRRARSFAGDEECIAYAGLCRCRVCRPEVGRP